MGLPGKDGTFLRLKSIQPPNVFFIFQFNLNHNHSYYLRAIQPNDKYWWGEYRIQQFYPNIHVSNILQFCITCYWVNSGFPNCESTLVLIGQFDSFDQLINDGLVLEMIVETMMGVESILTAKVVYFVLEAPFPILC